MKPDICDDRRQHSWQHRFRFIEEGKTTWAAFTPFVQQPGKHLLVNAIIDEQLRENGGQDGGGDSQTEAAPGPVECPPQAQGQGRQREGELHVVVKV